MKLPILRGEKAPCYVQLSKGNDLTVNNLIYYGQISSRLGCPVAQNRTLEEMIVTFEEIRGSEYGQIQQLELK